MGSWRTCNSFLIIIRDHAGGHFLEAETQRNMSNFRFEKWSQSLSNSSIGRLLECLHVHLLHSYFEKGCRKSARDSPQRYCGWFWVHCSSKKFERMAREAMDICLWVLKESNKSRFDRYSVRNSELIISHITLRDCRVHNPLTTFLEIAVYKALKCIWIKRFRLNENSAWTVIPNEATSHLGGFSFLFKCYCSSKDISSKDLPLF